jgi:DNA-binding response OmpR family regulator
MNRILIIDDDIELCELLSDYLTPEGFAVETANEGEGGARRAQSGEHALVVLDVMLPGLNGFDVLRRIRENSQIPVIMLTARGDDVDRIVGLELGADDYLPKPFNPRELLARIRAIQRRSAQGKDSESSSTAPAKISVGDVDLDAEIRVVTRDGEAVPLTEMEFSLLHCLLQKAGKVVSREELVEKVLGRRLSPFDRSIDVHVSSLRKKLGHRIGGVERIRTVRGIGYLYART